MSIHSLTMQPKPFHSSLQVYSTLSKSKTIVNSENTIIAKKTNIHDCYELSILYFKKLTG